MEYLCRNCNYWNQEAPAVENKSDVGECEKLSHITNVTEPELILPVLHDGRPITDGRKEIEFITVANFGCNQFQAAA